MKNFFKVLLAMLLVLTICLSVVACGPKTPDNGDETPHEHSFVEGKCECGESDPNYVPPHEHSFVEGKCECGETDPNYQPPHEHEFLDGMCGCGVADPNYQAPHEHVFGDNGMCECGEIDPNFQGGIGGGGDEEYDYIVIASAEHGGSAGFLGYVNMYINDSFSSGYDNSVAYGLNEGDKVTLYAEANSGYVFAGWYYEAVEGGLGEFITLEKSYTFEASASVKYLAHFVNANEKFPVSIFVSGYGKVSVDNGTPDSSYNLKINAMQEIELTAIADDGNKFVGWYIDDEFYSDDETISVCIDFAKHIEAKFEGEWILFGAYVNESGYTGSGNPENQFLVVRTSPQTGERETIAVDHDRVFSLQYGDVVEFIAKPMEGYTFGAFRFDEIDAEFFGHDGYYKWTVDIAEDNSIIQAFFQPVGKSEEDVKMYVDYVDFFGDDCDDCYIYLNGVKVTKEMAASQSFMTKDQTKITIVPVECGHCEGFRYYMPTSGTIAGNVETGDIISFQMSTMFCRKVSSNFGNEYTFFFDICFGYEQVTADMTFGVDIDNENTGFDVRFENVMFGGEKTTIENTQDLFFGAVLGDTVRITPLNIPKGYEFNYIEVTIEYEAVTDDVVYKTIILDADDFANGYCDLKIEYPGHYSFYASVTKVVN